MKGVPQRDDAQLTIIGPFELVEVAKQMKKTGNNKASRWSTNRKFEISS